MQHGYTALTWAAMHDHTHIVKYLTEETTALVNATDAVSNYCIAVFVLALFTSQPILLLAHTA